EVLRVALGNVEIVVGQVAPPALHLALELGPLAANDVLVHLSLLRSAILRLGEVRGLPRTHSLPRAAFAVGQGFVARGLTAVNAPARIQPCPIALARPRKRRRAGNIPALPCIPARIPA